MDRRQALVRDIARLFVKYDLADWRVIIDSLRNRGADYNAIAQAVEDLASKSENSRRLKSQPSAERFLADLSTADPKKAKLLKGLYERLMNKELAPRLADLRELCLRLGIKDKLPAKRDGAVMYVLRHLATLSEEALVSALKEMPVDDRDLQDEYNKWFKMIYTSG